MDDTNKKRKAYPSDINDFHWELIQRIIPESPNRGRKIKYNLRDIVNAITYIWRSNCQWRMLPHDFPSWESVRSWHDKFEEQGLLDEIKEIIKK